MAKHISENRLAKKIGIEPARLRLWRNKFLHSLVAPKSIGEQRGSSLKLGRSQVFTIMMVAEVIRHGGTKIDAFDKAQQIGIDDSEIGFLYRRVSFVPGSDELKMTSWKRSPTPPVMEADDLSLLVINLKTLRERVDKLLRERVDKLL